MQPHLAALDFTLCSTPELTCGIAYLQEEEATGIGDNLGFVNKAALDPACFCENSAETSDLL